MGRFRDRGWRRRLLLLRRRRRPVASGGKRRRDAHAVGREVEAPRGWKVGGWNEPGCRVRIIELRYT